MASKANVQATVDGIFLAAMKLFRENGYKSTNIRQIAEEAGVSLGLVNHYFGSKQALGYSVLETLIRYVVMNYNGPENPDPMDLLLTDAVETRAVNQYLSNGPFRRFYLDTLQEDIFFSYVEKRPEFLLERLQDRFHFTISRDMAMLYSRCIPFMVEKTLVLKKEEGLFAGISQEEIPYLIFISSYTGRLPQEVLDDCDRKARVIAAEMTEKLLPSPDQDTLRSLGLLPVQVPEKK